MNPDTQLGPRSAKALIPADVRAEIVSRLQRAEREHDVKVLIAIESGSRAWGFESVNSDFDARFIYVHRQAWYLRSGVQPQRDVIEYPILDELDINGWELRKAIQLFWKGNPVFVEWMQSPIVYVEHSGFAPSIRALLPQLYRSNAGVHHYLHMARGNHRDYLQADQVPLKKYLYVLRPLLAAVWIERYGAAPPMRFAELLPLIEHDVGLMAAIDALLRLKRSGQEMGLSDRIPAIDAYIASELARERQMPAADERGAGAEVLDALFQATLREAWA